MSRSRRNDSPVHRGHVQSDDEIFRPRKFNKYHQLSQESRAAIMQSRNERREYRTCTRKIPFETQEAAINRGGADVYRCKYCQKWHRTESVRRMISGINKMKGIKGHG